MRDDHQNAVASVALPFYFGSVTPEQFKIVEVSVFVVKEMDNDIDKIDDDPAALLQAVAAQGLEASITAQFTQFVPYRAYLLLASTGADDKVFGHRANIGQLEDHDIRAMTIMGQQRHLASEVTTGLQGTVA